MIDRISIPHLIFEDTYPLLLKLGKNGLFYRWYFCDLNFAQNSRGSKPVK
jgi:hypothetical protein